MALQSIVVEDQFSSQEDSNSLFKGDVNSYFPIQFTSRQFKLEGITTTNWTDPANGYSVYKYGLNELIIDDNMFLYSSRSTKFMNLEHSESGQVMQKDWTGKVEGRDIIMLIGVELSSESKIITRTRRKVWDDLSLRGGQYSAVMILLTAIYTLFQGPFQDMKYGLKFAEMRAMDGLSDSVEQQLYHKVKSQVDCCFMIKFWAMYWFSYLYYAYLSLFRDKSVVSDFVEYFTFIMHMKNQVTFQLSMRNVA